MIPYGRQFLDEKDINEVVNVLKSGFLTTGPKVKEFEEKFSSEVGAKYAVAVSSGTAGLHLAALAAGIRKGDEVITTPLTFAASANCALYCGAKPVFADITEQGIINPAEIEKRISSKTKAVIPVHYSGMPCSMKEIKKIAEEKKLIVIEDACHALGASYECSRIGDCKYSDMAVFSFHPVKHITTGEGGMITTNSKEIYEKLVLLRSHGITKDNAKFESQDEGGWHQEMRELGFNYRITDIQCALGISQLEKLGSFVEKRKEIAGKYGEAFSRIDGVEPVGSSESSYHLYVIKVKDSETRLKLYNHLKKEGIMCQVHYVPVYLHPYYQKLGYKKGLCPKAEKFYERILSIPIFYSLTDDEQSKVISSIGDFFGK
jgi:UDP-4-amino-4,6-dideoxy-N-acetyl-beta-L-altrosamine transaminase